jgi:hypothetical protein
MVSRREALGTEESHAFGSFSPQLRSVTEERVGVGIRHVWFDQDVTFQSREHAGEPAQGVFAVAPTRLTSWSNEASQRVTGRSDSLPWPQVEGR